MSTVTAPVLPAATSAQAHRARDRARGDAAGAGSQDFAAVLDGHLAASKKSAGSKPAGRSAHDRDERDNRVDAGSSSSASATPPGVAGQVASRAAAGDQTAATGAAGSGEAVTEAVGAAADDPAAGSGATPAQNLLGAAEDSTDADTSAGGTAPPEGSGTASVQVPGSDATLPDGTTADDAGARSGQPAQSVVAAGRPPAERSGQPGGVNGGGNDGAVETITLAGQNGEAGSATAPGAVSGALADGADDSGAAGDRVADLVTTPAGATSAPTTAKSDGAQGAAPTTAAPATPVVAQVAPAVARVVSRGDGEHRMMLKLHPADLGEIHLTVTVRGDHVDVDIAAGSQARDLLRDGSAHLRSLLESIGRSPGQLVLRDLPSAPATSPATTAGGAGPDTGSGAASYAGDGAGRGDTGRDQPGTRGGAARPDPLAAPRDTATTRTIRTNGVLGGSALDVTV